MSDVIFPKRTPTPRELDARPVPSDYRPKKMRFLGASGIDSESYLGGELPRQNYPEASTEISSQVGLNQVGLNQVGLNQAGLNKIEEELNRDPLNEIAILMRNLTYGEMMELAQAIWKIRPEGEEVDQYSLPMMLHLWSTSSQH